MRVDAAGRRQLALEVMVGHRDAVARADPVQVPVDSLCLVPGARIAGLHLCERPNARLQPRRGRQVVGLACEAAAAVGEHELELLVLVLQGVYFAVFRRDDLLLQVLLLAVHLPLLVESGHFGLQDVDLLLLDVQHSLVLVARHTGPDVHLLEHFFVLSRHGHFGVRARKRRQVIEDLHPHVRVVLVR